MKSPLAFDQDPLFSNLSNPLVKIDIRLTQVKERLWFWKAPDFFWFWNEDEPDFFGILFEGTELHALKGEWFNRVACEEDLSYVRRQLSYRLHHAEWARVITLRDPRPQRTGVWRVLWRYRDFLLQNASTGRAVRFFPETNWGKKSPQWQHVGRFSHDSAFFGELFWDLLSERRGRLQTALEFLELPLEQQKDSIRFRRGNRGEFLAVLRAALIATYARYSWPESLTCRFGVWFHHSTFAAEFDLAGWSDLHHDVKLPPCPRIENIAAAFGLHLIPEFALHSVALSPLMLLTPHNKPWIYVLVQGPFTAHESMEAIMIVRDWLTENAPELLADWQ